MAFARGRRGRDLPPKRGQGLLVGHDFWQSESERQQMEGNNIHYATTVADRCLTLV